MRGGGQGGEDLGREEVGREVRISVSRRDTRQPAFFVPASQTQSKKAAGTIKACSRNLPGYSLIFNFSTPRSS